jgi:lipopolysaccharide export LptBFGC system permease protein LptF
MKLLDRYIARQYLTNIAALLVILACFVVAIDVSLNLSRYWNVAVELSKTSSDSALRRVLITVLLIADIWWPRLLSLFNFLLGLVLVGAMGFTCTQLVRHRELVALLTAGQSLFRVARPIVMVAIAMTGVQALNQEFVIPRIAPLLTRDQGDAGRRNLGSARVPPTVDGKGRVFSATTFDADAGTITDLYVWDRDRTGVAQRRIHAASARWHAGGWDLDGVEVESRVQGQQEASEAPKRIETDLDPTMLKMKRYAGYGQNLSWAQAASMLRRLDQSGADTEEARKTRDRLLRASLGRVSTMCSNLLTLLIAMSFFLTREPRNMMIQSLKCAPMGIVSLMGAVLGTAATVPGLPTSLSVFLPVMVLAPAAVAMVSRVKS